MSLEELEKLAREMIEKRGNIYGDDNSRYSRWDKQPETVLKLIEVVKTTARLRKEHLDNGSWYLSIGCEHAESVDEALKALDSTSRI